MKFSQLIAALFSVALLLGVSGCEEKEQSKSFQWSGQGTEMTLTYYYKDDKVLRQTANNKFDYAAVGVKSKEEAKSILGPISQKYQNIKGITEKVDYQDTYALETLNVDYSTVNFADLNALQGAEFTGEVKDGISMKKSEALLKARGFKDVK